MRDVVTTVLDLVAAVLVIAGVFIAAGLAAALIVAGLAVGVVSWQVARR